MRSFHLEVVTPDGLMFEGEIESLLVRTTDGDVEFLAGHMDYMATVDTGRARIVAEGKERFASSSGGFVTVTRGEVKLVCTTFEFKENIDLERAKRAKENAEAALARAKDGKATKLAEAKLKRAINRIRVYELK